MGYRQYLCEVDKVKLDEMRKMSLSEFFNAHCEIVQMDEDEEDKEVAYLPLYEVFNKKIFEFGKNSPLTVDAYRNYDKFFDDDNLSLEYQEESPVIISKDCFLDMIEKCRQMVYDNFIDNQEKLSLTLSKDDNISKSNLFELCRYFEKKIESWSIESWKPCGIANMNLDKDEITCSWEYEYIFLDMIRIYKSFDFEKNQLVMFGW